MTVSEKTDIETFVEENGKKYGIPKIAIKALKDFGIYDARALTVLTIENLQNMTKISYRTAEVLTRAAQEVFRGEIIQTAEDYRINQNKTQKYFTSGSKEVDNLLEGGFRTGMLTEIVGEYRTGKTQLCLTAAVTAQLPEEEGGMNSSVIYINTDSYINCQHYLRIGKRFGLEEDKLLKNLLIVQAEHKRLFNQAINRLPGYIQTSNTRLVIIDSLIAPFENEYTLQQFYLQQKDLQKLFGFLKRLAIGFNFAVLFTNQVKENIGPSSRFVPHKASGGEAVKHASDMRLFVKKLKGNSRRMKIEKCSFLPCERADFYLSKYGVTDDEYFELPQIIEEKRKEDEEMSNALMDGMNEIEELKKKRTNTAKQNEKENSSSC